MESVAAQRTLKFMLGATMGFGFGLAFIDSIRESPAMIGTLWAVGIVLAGFAGIRVFNVDGKFTVSWPGEKELTAEVEVSRVVAYTTLGVVLMVWWVLGG